MSAQLHHVTVFVRDLERSLQLFKGILGMELAQRLNRVKGKLISKLIDIPDFQADLVFLKHPDQRVSLELLCQTGGVGQEQPNTAGPSFGVSLLVKDLDGIHARLDREGWTPLSRPLDMTDPAGRPVRLFCFRTDEGLMVELIEHAN